MKQQYFGTFSYIFGENDTAIKQVGSIPSKFIMKKYFTVTKFFFILCQCDLLHWINL